MAFAAEKFYWVYSHERGKVYFTFDGSKPSETNGHAQLAPFVANWSGKTLKAARMWSRDIGSVMVDEDASKGRTPMRIPFPKHHKVKKKLEDSK